MSRHVIALLGSCQPPAVSASPRHCPCIAPPLSPHRPATVPVSPSAVPASPRCCPKRDHTDVKACRTLDVKAGGRRERPQTLRRVDATRDHARWTSRRVDAERNVKVCMNRLFRVCTLCVHVFVPCVYVTLCTCGGGLIPSIGLADWYL